MPIIAFAQTSTMKTFCPGSHLEELWAQPLPDPSPRLYMYLVV